MTQSNRTVFVARTLGARWGRARAARSGAGRWLAAGLLAGLIALDPSPSAGQSPRPERAAAEVFAGEELENYLRLLQISGKSALYPWSIRSFSMAEVSGMAPAVRTHPWAGRFDFHLAAGTGPELLLVAPRMDAVFNTGFPYGENDGPVWAGRGATVAARGGVAARYRWFSLKLAPVAYWAQNAPFESPSSVEAVNPFQDWRFPRFIDLPQRFGERAFGRIDPGQSTLRADVGPVAVGVSTANQVWGPAAEFPLVLGTNAPGFPHIFAGTSHPWDLWVAKAHGRFVWGRLSQSAYAASPADSSKRFMAGLVMVATPRGVPGLEIGAGRFFHMPWTADGPSLGQFLKPLETFTKVNLSTGKNRDQEIEESIIANQIASIFFRWVLPGSGFEAYGELASEDHRLNLRDFYLEPDHDVAYTLGLRKLWNLDESSFWVLRAEALSGTPSHLQRGRRQEPFYIHANMRQGHTEAGQILGSPAAYGGSASLVAADLYGPGGRWTVAWRRTRRLQAERYLETGTSQPIDVQQGFGVERVLFLRNLDLTAGLDGIYEINRDFVKDAVNVRASIGVRARL